MQKNPKIIMIIAIVGAIGAFGYFQYVSVTHLHVAIVDSKIVERTNDGTLYNMQLEFKNPSLMILNVGKTDFVISVEDQDLGSSILEPSTIPTMVKNSKKCTWGGCYLRINLGKFFCKTWIDCCNRSRLSKKLSQYSKQIC